MSRVYTVEFEAVAVTTAVDFFEVTPADDKPIRLLGVMLAQSSDFGDAQDELLRVRVIRGFTTSGSGGSAPTPVAVSRNSAAAGFTAETLNTTLATTGTTVNVHSDCFNVRVGAQIWWPEGCQPEASQADTTIVVRLMAAPADSLTMSGTLYVEEI